MGWRLWLREQAWVEELEREPDGAQVRAREVWAESAGPARQLHPLPATRGEKSASSNHLLLQVRWAGAAA